MATRTRITATETPSIARLVRVENRTERCTRIHIRARNTRAGMTQSTVTPSNARNDCRKSAERIATANANTAYAASKTHAERKPNLGPNERPLKIYTEPAWAYCRPNSTKEYATSAIATVAPTNASAVAVPSVAAVSDPLRAIDPVGRMIATDSAITSKKPTVRFRLLRAPAGVP